MSLASDFRYALRLLARSPVFTTTAVLSLALGIAASAAIFSLADAMLLRPRIGVVDPPTLVDIGRTTRGEGFDNFGYPLFAAMRERSTLLQEISAQRWGPEVMSLGDAKSSERVYASLVSGNYFHVIGTRPALGRFFLPEEDRTPGTHPVVVLNHRFWNSRFKADTALVGQTIRLNNLAMALLLLVAAGLFLRSLQEAATVDAGFNVENVDTLQVDTRIGGYRTDAEGTRAAETLIERFRLVPGVTAVGASRMVPLMGGRLGLGALRAPGYAGPDGSDAIQADWDVVSPGYFEALQIGLTRGRAFAERDRSGSPYVAIINEKLAAQLWPGRDPIGRKLVQKAGRNDADDRPLEIVGIARNGKYGSIAESTRNFIYVPLAQQFLSDITFYVRRAPGQSRIADLRRVLVAFDPMLPVIYAQTLQDATAIGLLPQRLAAWIAASVGSIGLLLAALGLYGLTAFSVAQRTREIALRMALGASREAVLSLVLRQSGRLAIIGTAIGLALAIGLGMLVRSLLAGIGSVDPLAFGLATALLTGVLLAASWVPARRAARMEPMRALRAE